MAYDSSNEIQTVLGTFEKNQRGDKIRVSKIENKKYNSLHIDVRNMYTATDGEARYSPKTGGVRLNAEMASEVIVAMLMALDLTEVQDIFEQVQKEKVSVSENIEPTDEEQND